MTTNIPGPPFYQFTTVTNPTVNTFSINVELGFIGFGTTIPAAPGYFEIAKVKLNKMVPNAPAGDMEWVYTGGTTGTVAFLDDEATQIFATTPSCLVGLSTAPLPVELLSFSATQGSPNDALLDWSTASEQNNAGFWLEHSLDGRSWSQLTWLRCQRRSPPITSTYTRLRFPDHTTIACCRRTGMARKEASEVRSLTFAVEREDFALRVWPNPTSGE